MRRPLLLLLSLLCCGAAALGGVLNAQQSAAVTIGQPANGAVLPAGADYATDVLGDPWDMSNPEDISQYVTEAAGFAGDFGFNGGRVGGTIVSGDASIAFLYRGMYLGANPIINPGRNGLRFPIDSSVYKKLSFKMSSSGNPGQHPQIYWFHEPFGQSPTGGFGVKFAGILTVTGNQIFEVDLTTNLNDGTPWTGASHLIRGFRIDPNLGATGHQVFFDWVRITRADSDGAAVQQTISWTGGAANTVIDVIDAAGTAYQIASGQPASGNFNWKYGGFPPGQYTLRITSPGQTAQTRSFRINAPPALRITDPDESGGEDFATTILANPWDMNDAADIRLTDHVINGSFHDGLFDASSDGFTAGDGTGDPGVWFFNHTNNLVPIDTSRYRFLTYRLNVNPPWVQPMARIFWSFNANGLPLTVSRDVIVFPGMQSYTIDLAALTAANGGLEAGGTPWTTGPVRLLRIDPHELPNTGFQFDDVKLAAMDEAQNGHFLIKFTGSDPDVGDTLTVNLFYSTSRSTAGRTAIASNVPASSGTFDWTTTGVTPGTYYISGDVTDGRDTRTYFSSGQVLVPGAGALKKGDELITDFAGQGLYTMYNSGPGFAPLHAANPGPMTTGDVDGDGKKDVIVVFQGYGVWAWQNNSFWRHLHAFDAHNLITADLDGNGVAEVLVDFPGFGIWVWTNNAFWRQLHPAAPAQMLAGDIDGNGKDDAIIDFPGFGIWIWMNDSSWRQLHALNATSLAVGDLDGGGRAEVLVGFAGFGTWVFYNNASWGQLHPALAPRMATGNLDGAGGREAILDFPGFGLWVWRNNSSWSQLHPLSPESFITADIDGNGLSEAVIDFGAAGIWAWMNNAGYAQLHVNNPEALAAGNIDGK